MKTIDSNKQILQSYLQLLKNFSVESKLELIEELSKSIKIKLKEKEESEVSLYGAFESDKTADEIIQEIRSSRNFNRTTASF